MINLHVLLVDDEAEIRDAVAAALTRDPFFIVHNCASGRQAHAQALARRPDLLLLEAMLPDMDGPTVLARLRADRRTAPIPVVFMTAGGGPRERARWHALGAAGVIDKPFDPRSLAAELRGYVAVEGVLSPAREDFLQRLEADARALSACRRHLAQTQAETVLMRITQIAHSLAGAGGIYGFAGITCESTALSDAAEGSLAGRAKPIEVERALDRLLERIGAG